MNGAITRHLRYKAVAWSQVDTDPPPEHDTETAIEAAAAWQTALDWGLAGNGANGANENRPASKR